MFKSLLLLAGLASAKVVTYNWDVEWVNAAPDGFSRPVIGINGQWPCPAIEVDKGDRLIVNVYNKLGNESTSIHWHGLFQEGSGHMDGPAHVAQCPIPPGESFKYDFKITQSGTYWYHSHIGGQYADGLRGPLIIHDKSGPLQGMYDEEYTLTVSDWYHGEVPVLLATQLNFPNNTGFRPPTALAGLLNEFDNKAKNQTFKVVPGKKYMFRIINLSALTPAYMWIDGHTMKIVEVDGLYHQPADAEMISIAPAQRYNVIVEAKDNKDANFAWVSVFDRNPNLVVKPLGYQINTTVWLEYDSAKPLPPPPTVANFNAIFDDVTLVPYDNMAALSAPTTSVELDFNFALDSNGVPKAYFNGVSYVNQKTPTLFTALTTGDDATNPLVYGQVNPIVVEKDEVVELIINNNTPGHHPFHLHGHHFQVITRSGLNAGAYTGNAVANQSPMRRDTVQLEGGGHVVLRFQASNPGVWLFHCHIEWHVEMGLTATIIEAPLELQKILPFSKVPQAQKDLCAKQCLPFEGNAGGNTEDHLDLSNANTEAEFPAPGAVFEGPTCALPSSTTSATGSATATGSYSATYSGTATGTDGPEPTCHGKNCGGNGHGGCPKGKDCGNGGDDGDDNGNGGHGGGCPKGKDCGSGGNGGNGGNGGHGCPAGYVCNGPDTSKPTGGSQCEGDVYWMTVTEAYYYTSYEPTTSTVCARPTTW